MHSGEQDRTVIGYGTPTGSGGNWKESGFNKQLANKNFVSRKELWGRTKFHFVDFEPVHLKGPSSNVVRTKQASKLGLTGFSERIFVFVGYKDTLCAL